MFLSEATTNKKFTLAATAPLPVLCSAAVSAPLYSVITLTFRLEQISDIILIHQLLSVRRTPGATDGNESQPTAFLSKPASTSQSSWEKPRLPCHPHLFQRRRSSIRAAARAGVKFYYGKKDPQWNSQLRRLWENWWPAEWRVHMQHARIYARSQQ